MDKEEILDALKGGLIVSCQAEEDEPLGRPEILAAMARAAVAGGAVAVRTSGPQNILAMRDALSVPVIGIYKRKYPLSDVIITPTLREAVAVMETGVPVIALDATRRERPGSEKLQNIFGELKTDHNLLLMADISTLEEGLRAAQMGFHLVGTTLSGYTDYSPGSGSEYQPDLQLVSDLVRELGSDFPVVAEGRIWSPESAVEAFKCGAYAVVVGSAVTRPTLIVKRFHDAILTSRK